LVNSTSIGHALGETSVTLFAKRRSRIGETSVTMT
jgi:hypothetical protein